MANLTMDEFEQCVTLLADGGQPAKLRDKLVRLNAFHSRRGLGTMRALSERLYQLSAGLRREVPATRAFQALWVEHVGRSLSEAAGRRLDDLANTINDQLERDGSVKEGCQAELEAKLAEYEDFLARKVGGITARLDTLQKAVPEVASILRAREILDVPLDPPDAEEHDHDHAHDHAHGHAHHHDHAHEHGDHAHAHDEHEHEHDQHAHEHDHEPGDPGAKA